MKKNSSKYYIALGIIFALFNVVAFVVPTDKTSTFWFAYAFTVIAFAVQIPLWITAFSKKETLKSKFLGVPVIYVGFTYLAVQLISFAVFMAIPTLPVWSAVIVCAIILALSVLSVIGGQAGVKEINRIDEKIKVKRAFVQFLQLDVEAIAEAEADAEVKAELNKLAEAVRFSDPMSHEMLAELEARINAKVEELKSADNKSDLIKEINMLLFERNKKCKILK